MSVHSLANEKGALSLDEIRALVRSTLAPLGKLKKVLVIHPDYSRHDFTELLVPEIYRSLLDQGLDRIDMLNAGGTHRKMTQEELVEKLGLKAFGSSAEWSKVGSLFNHEFDRPDMLAHVVDIPSEFVREKTKGHLDVPMAVTVNRLVLDSYDAIIAVSGTIPHEAIGYSGGTKIFFPGISGPEVIALLHWAAVLIGVPEIIGTLKNAARDVVNEGTSHIFKKIGGKPIVSFDMVYTEDAAHRVVPQGLFTGIGIEGFGAALEAASTLSSKLHIRYLDEPKKIIVQQLPLMYDEVWTAGKGSYKLQRPGVLAEDGEIVLLAPHIHCFHSHATMDAEIRQIGYHGRNYVVDYCRTHPQFNKNVASHVINVRGIGTWDGNIEKFPFKVTLATQISERECHAVGLGYRDPQSLRAEDFGGAGQLWIPDGGQWLYARR